MRNPKSLHATVKCDLRVITDGKQVMDIKPTKNLQNVAFQIDIATHLKKEDFLVVTFNLTNGINHPYKKPNIKLLHVQFSSSYPLQIIKG